MDGRHPADDTVLATLPRRMTINDVGITPKEYNTWSDASYTGDERPLPTSHGTMDVGRTGSDEDPFGFGFDLDVA